LNFSHRKKGFSKPFAIAASRTVKLGGTVATEKQMMKYE
jgi:hypothetical protein